MIRPGQPAIALLISCALLASSCGGSDTSGSGASSPETANRSSEANGAPAPESPASRHGEAATDLDRTPLSAADYALYTAIMGGASAMLADLSPEDRGALELERKVQSGEARASATNEAILARARELHRADEQLARLQGIDARYMKVKEKVEAAIGPRSRPPAHDDAVAQENLRFLEPHRRNIERLQRILADPLTREPSPALRVD